MKKLSFLLCSLVLLLGIVLLPDSSGSLEVGGATQNSAGSQVEPYSDYVETDGLGYAVNIATSQNEQSFNIGAPVIDETYLDSLTMRRTYKNQSYEQTKTGVDYATISQSLGAYFDTIKLGLIQFF